MSYTFPTPTGEIEMNATDQGLQIEQPMRRMIIIRWDRITGAGLVKAPGGSESIKQIPMAVFPPGIARAARFGVNSQQLVVAYRSERGKRKRFVLMVPLKHEDREAFLDEIQRWLGDRWIVEARSYSELCKRLGLPSLYGIAIPMTILLFVVSGLLLFGWWVLLDTVPFIGLIHRFF
ncbi:hypothetical protein GF380_04345 [Candidatus Uhrbacteria bacterium]|nr:hypothetical protein [Candidatus Uhrbacteria bacterium]MBD3284295.1 hypothetical protein [Candidatus Uhrbacteria bacterium]